MIAKPDGQLYDCERSLLHSAVLRARPAIALEVGTWRGGGSTLQIVSAMLHLKAGLLVTCEINSEFYAEANAFYVQKPFCDHCQIKLMPSRETINWLLETHGPPDFVFFDGSEDAQESLDDFLILEPRLRPGAVFMMHDWLTPDSHKADLLRPYLEASSGWRIVNLLKPPHSVGLVEAIKLG
jgi:predicted O-methyltransferase YrrM